MPNVLEISIAMTLLDHSAMATGVNHVSKGPTRAVDPTPHFAVMGVQDVDASSVSITVTVQIQTKAFAVRDGVANASFLRIKDAHPIARFAGKWMVSRCVVNATGIGIAKIRKVLFVTVGHASPAVSKTIRDALKRHPIVSNGMGETAALIAKQMWIVVVRLQNVSKGGV